MPLAPLKDPWQQVPIVEDGEEVRLLQKHIYFIQDVPHGLTLK